MAPPPFAEIDPSQRSVLALYLAAAEALDLWQPRFEVTECALDPDVDPTTIAQGRVVLRLAGVYHSQGRLGDRSTERARRAVDVPL